MPATLRDFALPPDVEPSLRQTRRLGAISYEHGSLDPQGAADLLELLEARGGASLRSLSRPRLWTAWKSAVSTFIDPASRERSRTNGALAASCRLSPSALDAGLETILDGVRGEAARLLLERAPRTAEPAPALLILPGNLPGLLVQSLLPALAVGRPVLIKSASDEPFFAPSFVQALTELEPVLASALAVLSWRGGEASLEATVYAKAGRVVAYGDESTAARIAQRCGSRAIVYGPKISIAIIAAGADLKGIAGGLARDVALFDQRGCLSIHAIFTAGSSRELAPLLAQELSALAAAWPPGPALPSELAGLRQALSEAELRGLVTVSADAATSGAGTVIVDPEPVLRPSPGLRCVRVHNVSRLSQLSSILAPWSGKLQGAALAGEEAWDLVPRLTELGFSRFTASGDLQATNALWFNGGIDPLAALS